ncbi:hypothetical protein D3C81_1303030 [compost metagenome]
MDIARGVQINAFEISSAVFLDAQQLRQCHTTRAWQRCGIDHIATPLDAHRLAPYRFVILEVVFADQALVSLHLRHQQIGCLALVELADALVGDALQGLRQLWLLERLADFHAAEVVIEVGTVFEQTQGIFAVLVLLGGDFETVLRIAYRRGDQLGPRQLAELLMRLPQAHDRTRHTGSAGADQAQVFDDLAFFIQVHIAAGGLGRRFSVVEEVRFAVHVQGHETTTANITGFGVGHSQGEGGGDCGVYCVTAFFHYIGSYLCSILIGRSHRATFQGHSVSR